MKDLKNKLTTGKNTKNKSSRPKIKGFGYQVLGFGSGGGGPAFIEATGGTITTSGDFKIHTFTGNGTFEVTAGGSSAGNDKVDYMVIAGGGGAGSSFGGGGGAGGYRESYTPAVSGPYTASPLANPDGALTLGAGSFPITVGAGGSTNASGSNSVFSSITSAGGGDGGQGSPAGGTTGGSGGGGVGTCLLYTSDAADE